MKRARTCRFNASHVCTKMMKMLRRMMPLLFVAFLRGQEKPLRLTFEVASIKPLNLSRAARRRRDQPEAGGSGI
jgi:hypothetical protein